MSAHAINRSDARLANQLRALRTEVDVLKRADGSARFSQGKTAILVAVYGPGQVSIRSEKSDRTTIEVVWKPKIGLTMLPHKQHQQRLQHIAETIILQENFPRSSLSIIIQELHDDGSIFACAVNGMCAALLNAGIPLRQCVAATALTVLPSGTLIMDPTLSEEKSESDNVSATTLTFAFTNGAAMVL